MFLLTVTTLSAFVFQRGQSRAEAHRVSSRSTPDEESKHDSCGCEQGFIKRSNTCIPCTSKLGGTQANCFNCDPTAPNCGGCSPCPQNPVCEPGQVLLPHCLCGTMEVTLRTTTAPTLDTAFATHTTHRFHTTQTAHKLHTVMTTGTLHSTTPKKSSATLVTHSTTSPPESTASEETGYKTPPSKLATADYTNQGMSL